MDTCIVLINFLVSDPIHTCFDSLSILPSTQLDPEKNPTLDENDIQIVNRAEYRIPKVKQREEGVKGKGVGRGLNIIYNLNLLV